MSNPTFKTKSLVIAGMGAGGMAAALAAVAHGQHVILLDTAPQCGGTVRQTLIHTLGGFYDGDGLLVNPGLSAELLSRLEAASPTTVKRRMGRVWVLNVDPDIYTRVLMDWLRTSSKLQVLPQSQITALQFDTENQQEPQICSVTLKTPEQEYLQPEAVEKFAEESGISHVPIIGYVTLPKEDIVQTLLSDADGKSAVGCNPKREGFVYKSTKDTSISVKCISNNWLLSNDG